MLFLYGNETDAGHILLGSLHFPGGGHPHQPGLPVHGSRVHQHGVPSRRPGGQILFPKVDFRNRRTGVKDTIFIVLGILVAEVFLFLVTHFYILRYRENVADWIGLPEILTNPVFIALILTTLAAGSYFFESWLDRLRPTAPAPITFTSDREPVTLPLGEILYVESNDATTTVVATGERRFKNITPISQWEAILSPHFLRIHRSYLVNKEAITRVDGDLLYIDDLELPISRKYKDAVLNACSVS